MSVIMSFEEQFGVSSALLLVLFGTLTLIWYSRRNRRSGPIRNVPWEGGLPIVGSYLRMFFGEPFFKLEEEWYKKYGNLFGAHGPGFPKLFLADPTKLADIFVKDFHTFSSRTGFRSTNEMMNNALISLRGEQWKRVRSIVSPAFTTNKLLPMIPDMNRCAELTAKIFVDAADSGQPSDCKRIFEGFVLDAVARTAYGINLESVQQTDTFTEKARAIFNVNFPLRIILTMCLPKLAKLFKVELLNTDSINFFSELSRHCMEKKKECKEQRKDLLQLLMDSLQCEDKEERGEENKKETITVTELIAQGFIFFIVGFDTTSTALAMALYFLAINHDCQRRLVKEVDTVWRTIRENGKTELDYESLNELKYVDTVIWETLRRSPPGAKLERVASREYTFKGTDLTIPQGSVVYVPVYALHHDPKFFPDPLRFDPDRFLPENRGKIVPNTYFPFGSGPKNCVGSRLAVLVMKICLFHVFRLVTFDVCPEKTRLKFNQGLGFLQPRNVFLKVLRRDH